MHAPALMPSVTAKAISASLLEQIALEQLQHEAEVGDTRLSHFIKAAQSTDETTFKTAIKEFREGKALGKATTVRASEFQAIYYAMLHGAEFSKQGYGSAVSSARIFLEMKGIRSNGSPILSDEQKAENRLKVLRRKATTAALKLVDTGEPDSAGLLQETIRQEMAKLQGEAEAKAAQAKLEKIDNAVAAVMAEGAEYAAEFLRRLNNALNT